MHKILFVENDFHTLESAITFVGSLAEPDSLPVLLQFIVENARRYNRDSLCNYAIINLGNFENFLDSYLNIMLQDPDWAVRKRFASFIYPLTTPGIVNRVIEGVRFLVFNDKTIDVKTTAMAALTTLSHRFSGLTNPVFAEIKSTHPIKQIREMTP